MSVLVIKNKKHSRKKNCYMAPVTMNYPQVNCKICLKSTGLHEFFGVFGRFCVVLFEGSSSYKELPPTFIIFPSKKKMSSNPTWIVPWLVTNMKHLWPKYLHSSFLWEQKILEPQSQGSQAHEAHVILYNGEPLSIHVRKVIPFYLNDPVLQFSHTGYQTESMSL